MGVGMQNTHLVDRTQRSDADDAAPNLFDLLELSGTTANYPGPCIGADD